MHRRRRAALAGHDAGWRARPTAPARGIDAATLIALRVPTSAAGLRLDRFLSEQPAVGSRAAAERLIAGGSVLVDGATRPKSHRLAGGEEVRVELPEVEDEPAAEPEPPGLAVVWEDEHLLVVDKPAGVVVHPGAGRARGTLAGALRGRGAAGGPPERAGIVHRLDRDTSGLLVVARSEAAFTRLQSLVRRRALEREYLALVRGRPRSRSGRIEAAIGRDRQDPTRQSLDTDTPRNAVTHFELEQLLAEHALLRVRLETGRTHQIRVHLAAIDLPVVGDRVYGVPGLGLSRQFLHASRLAFPHPLTGAAVDVSSPLPAELGEALALASTG
ncbi:MAG TPA: RluA family pseudouridine synthase [Gaiellaceae bacterium]|nr:RluA family pseudouridine synthase [Gaiellaceae bacterium]